MNFRAKKCCQYYNTSFIIQSGQSHVSWLFKITFCCSSFYWFFVIKFMNIPGGDTPVPDLHQPRAPAPRLLPVQQQAARGQGGGKSINQYMSPPNNSYSEQE